MSAWYLYHFGRCCKISYPKPTLIDLSLQECKAKIRDVIGLQSPERHTGAKFHEVKILLIFGLGLQIMIHLIILAFKARDANIMDITGAAAFGRGPLWCR